MKKIFLSFASSNLRRSIDRIRQEAHGLNFYDSVVVLDENSLEPNFREKFKDYLKIGTRGYGYWSWKPQIIMQALNEASNGDVIQYTDSGCRLNKKGITRLAEYFEIAATAKNGILGFSAKPPANNLIIDNREFPLLLDSAWIKGDLLDYFDVRSNADVICSPTIGAGIIFVRKCPESITIIKRWLSVIEAGFNFIDDTQSVSDNLPTFIEHRHDQAIFSLIAKLEGVTLLSAYEYWYPSRDGLAADWDVLKDYPIHAVRDKDYGPLTNTYLRIRNKFGKLLKQVFNGS